MRRVAVASAVALILAGCAGSSAPPVAPSSTGGAAEPAATIWPGLFRERPVTLTRHRRFTITSDLDEHGRLPPPRSELGHEVRCVQQVRRDGRWAWSRLRCRLRDDELAPELEAVFVTDGAQLWRAPAGRAVRDRRDVERIAAAPPFMPSPLVEGNNLDDDDEDAPDVDEDAPAPVRWQRLHDQDEWCLLTRQAGRELLVCVAAERGVTRVGTAEMAEGAEVANWFEQVAP